jgi:hypothetical protein
MRKVASAVTLVSALLFSAVAGALFIDSAKANGFIPEYEYLPEITINRDGSVTPETSVISRVGNVYTLTADVEGFSILIECNDIVFDGVGYTINTIDGDSPCISLAAVNCVTIKNAEVIGRFTNIYLNNSSHCLITEVKTNKRVYLADGSNFNTITKSNITMLHTFLGNAGNNLIVRNNILQELGIGSSNNSFSRNNFFLTEFSYIADDNFWDDGLVGNYWCNYSIKYPNASEIGNTGISNTPYIIDRESYSTLMFPNAKNVDNYPLMYPYDTEKDLKVFPLPESILAPEPEPSLTVPVVAASAVTIAAVCLGLLLYFRKRKRGYT